MQFLLREGQNKTPVVVAGNRRSEMLKGKINKTISTVLTFIRILYLKQQNNVLR